MNSKTLFLLIGAAVLALGIAIAIQTARQPRSLVEGATEPLVRELRDHINDVSGITLTGADGKVIATLKRGTDGWTITERSDSPADVGKIRELLLKLDQSMLLEQKTANPARYAEIGVDDVKNKDAKGVRIDITGLSQPVSLVVGLSNAVNGVGTFVRREGEAQSWLASGTLTVGKTAAEWQKRDLMDIAANRIKSVTLTGTDGKKVTIYKDSPGDNVFQLADVPKDRKAGQAIEFNGLATVLASLKAEEVLSAKEIAPPENPYKAEYVTFDGLIVTATAWDKAGKNYAQFAAKLDTDAANAKIDADQAKAKTENDAATSSAKPATGTPATPATGSTPQSDASQASAPPKPVAVSDPAKDRQDKLAALNKEVDALNKTFTGWTFVLQSHKFANMRRNMEEMLEPLLPKSAGVQRVETLGATKVPGATNVPMHATNVAPALAAKAPEKAKAK